MDSKDRRLYLAVAACALVPYVPALWNGFALDDLYIIVWNPLVHSLQGAWRAFAAPYWPPDLGGQMYRPLPLATFAVDWTLTHGHPVWFHAMNLLWHAGVAVIVTALAFGSPSPEGRGGQGVRTALAAGLLFAVHPVHVEAVANVIGLGELMAAAGVCLAVYAAVVRQNVWWSGAALVLGLLSKENALVAPALIVAAWIIQPTPRPRPPRQRMAAFLLSWLVIAGAYVAVRGVVLHPYARLQATAPVFLGESAIAGRFTAVAVLSDVLRLLVFPLKLRVDYSPAERTIVRSVLDGRLILGLASFALWAWLLVMAWRRQRKVEAYGLVWIAIAFLPVSNLLFSTGVLAGAIRSALRTPVWRNDFAVTASILEDSPNSYRGPARIAAIYQSRRQPERALAALREATRIYDRDPTLFIAGADAALTLGNSHLADSLLARAERLCYRCPGSYRTQALAARSRGDSAVADSLLARMP